MFFWAKSSSFVEKTSTSHETCQKFAKIHVLTPFWSFVALFWRRNQHKNVFKYNFDHSDVLILREKSRWTRFQSQKYFQQNSHEFSNFSQRQWPKSTFLQSDDRKFKFFYKTQYMVMKGNALCTFLPIWRFKSCNFFVHFDTPGLVTDCGRTDGTVAPPRANCPANVSRHCFGRILVSSTRIRLSSITIIVVVVVE